MAEGARNKSYMTREQLEAYLADLRNNRPQRPSGRPQSAAAQKRWSFQPRSSTVPPVTTPESPGQIDPPRLYTSERSPSRTDSLLRRRKSHKRAQTAGSILTFASGNSAEKDKEADDGKGKGKEETQSDGEVLTRSSSRASSTKKRRDTATSFREFTASARSAIGGITHGRSQSVSSKSSGSSSGSDLKKRVSWNLPGENGSICESPLEEKKQVMPPVHPPRPEDSPRIEQELAQHFGGLTTQAKDQVAPLRITKSLSGRERGSGDSFTRTLPVVREKNSNQEMDKKRVYGSPLPPRRNYVEPWKMEPTQHNKVQYTVNPQPLPSPPNTGSENGDGEGEKELLKELGRRPLPKPGTPPDEGGVRKNNTKYGSQVPPPPRVEIGVVHLPPQGANTRPIPSISVPDEKPRPIPTISLPDDNPRPIPSITIEASKPPIPTISFPDDDPPSSRNIPSISLPDDPPAAPGVPSINLPGDQPTPPAYRRPLPRPRPSPSVSSNHSISSTINRGGPRASCSACTTPIEGRIVSASSLRFHPTCFRCAHCRTGLEHVGFFPEPPAARQKRLQQHPNSPPVLFYCHLDFHELFSPRCKSCKTPIEGEVVVACGNTWHEGHFFCAECGDPFDKSSRFVEKDGYAWCTGCYEKRFSGKCAGCKGPILETVVKALGREWCVGCFVCTECRADFPDGRFFIREKGGKEVPCCVACEERRLKQNLPM